MANERYVVCLAAFNQRVCCINGKQMELKLKYGKTMFRGISGALQLMQR